MMIQRKELNNLLKILVKRDKLIKQFIIQIDKEEWKFDTIYDFYNTLITITQAAIF
ncbi:unnamed protein product [Paramecium sonneborni]|uniref:Uncharacterized protein n=1 Tax=Paramecium sonneborni TaxID=65129 RepID=A0A8S1RRJ4_9CILI|nr:unnamed protein product [Paramecium sonneborni]